jgi:hypothetical protein
LFGPEVVLPAQLFAPLREQLSNKGECKLLVAVLEEAVECFQKYLRASEPPKRRLFQEAEHWIMSEGDTAPAFSFEHICGVLGIDPDYLRRGLQRWRDMQTVPMAETSASASISWSGTGPRRACHESLPGTAPDPSSRQTPPPGESE